MAEIKERVKVITMKKKFRGFLESASGELTRA